MFTQAMQTFHSGFTRTLGIKHQAPHQNWMANTADMPPLQFLFNVLIGGACSRLMGD
jgi:hypothetical protein